MTTDQVCITHFPHRMAKFVFNSYLLLCVILRASTGLPVCAEHHAQCVPLFRSLLQNVAGLLDSSILCFGIQSDKVTVWSQTETVHVCAPNPTQNSGCVSQRKSSFNESECWRNIMTDLSHYHAAIKFYLMSPLRRPQEEEKLLQPTLDLIDRLKKSCSIKTTKDHSAEEAAVQMWGSNSFDNQHEMCKVMRGFHIRAITMNRAIRYMSSRAGPD